MSLLQLTDRVAVWRGGANFAIVQGPAGLILIDSGLDAGNVRKALREYEGRGERLLAIINTHSHADHIGGNADLVKRTGCEVWASPREAPWIRWPDFEPAILHGGAYPPPGLQVKFLQAPPTPKVAELPLAGGPVTIAGVDLEIVPTPGHSPGQVAVAVDGVLVAADAIFRPEILARHPVIFMVHVAEYLSSLKTLAARPERYVLPGHGDLVDRSAAEGDPLPEIIRANVDSCHRIQNAILTALSEHLIEEELLYRVAGELGKQLESEPQYYLDRAAVAAHTSFMIHQGQLQVKFAEGRRLLTR